MFNRTKTGELIVKRRLSPRAKLVIVGGFMTVLVLSAGWIYNYGLSMAGFDRLSANRQQQRLQEEVNRVNTENQDLRETLARAQRSLQMEQTAFQELDRSLKSSAQEIVKLRDELNFYRNILSPLDKKTGLRIQNLYIEPAGDANHFRYKLVLIQALKHDRAIQGKANFAIVGAQGGKDIVISIPTTQDRPIQVNFKYFQDIEGKFELPKNFKPKQIKVSVTLASGAQTVEETYEWPKV